MEHGSHFSRNNINRGNSSVLRATIALLLSLLLALTPGLAFATQPGADLLSVQETDAVVDADNEDSSEGMLLPASDAFTDEAPVAVDDQDPISGMDENLYSEGNEPQGEDAGTSALDAATAIAEQDSSSSEAQSDIDAEEQGFSAAENQLAASSAEEQEGAEVESLAALSEDEESKGLSTQAAAAAPNEIAVAVSPDPIKCGESNPATFTFSMKNASNPANVKYRVDKISMQVSIDGTTAYVDDYINSDKSYYAKNTFTHTFMASGWYRIDVTAIEGSNNQKIGSASYPFYVGAQQDVPWSDYPTINDQANNLARQLNLPSSLEKAEADYTKVMWAHSYLVSEDAKTDEKSEYVGPTGALLRKQGTSKSYQQAMRLLLSAASVTTWPVEANGRAWTLVKIGSQWTHVDAAADINQPSGLKWTYLGATDVQMKRLRSAFTAVKGKEATNYRLNYYAKFQAFDDWLSSIESKIKTNLNAKKTAFTVACDKSVLGYSNPGVNAIVLDSMASYLTDNGLSGSGYNSGNSPIVSYVYTGSSTSGSGYFKVSIRNLSSAYLSIASVPDKTYTGGAIKPTPTLTLNGKTLKSGTDYTTTYSNNTNVGTATITFTGRGTFSGTAKKTFKIVKAPLSSAKITGIVNKTYTGSKITQTPVVQFGNKTLTAKDYTVAYSNNTNAGTATAIFTGKGNFTGTVKKTFKINKASMSYVTVTGMLNKWYTGSKITQSLVLKRGSTKLTSKDYTVSYSNNVNLGTATVTITGKGNYSGTKKGTFKISKGPLSLATFTGIVDKPYTGKKVTQSFKIKLSGRTLTSKDYTVKYANNVKIGTATMTITGKGNYTGTVKKTFKIKTSFLNSKITASNMMQTVTGKALTPSVTVKLGNSTLKRGTDYYLTYNGSTKAPTKAGSYTVKAIGKGKYAGTKTVGTFKLVKAPVKSSTPVSFNSRKTYEISSVYNSNFVLDAAGAKPSIGANVSIWTKNGGKNQKWYLVPDGKGYYYIKSSANKNFLLDAAGKKTTIGANVSIWAKNGGMNQKWKIEKYTDGTYTIRCASNSKLVLDAAGASPRKGANVSAWSANGGLNQRWRIKAV